jgi:uncharacterized membrane protein|nr:MAG TPA: hypothetical protein [Caudoviricetes sp.]
MSLEDTQKEIQEKVNKQNQIHVIKFSVMQVVLVLLFAAKLFGFVAFGWNLVAYAFAAYIVWCIVHFVLNLIMVKIMLGLTAKMLKQVANDLDDSDRRFPRGGLDV